MERETIQEKTERRSSQDRNPPVGNVSPHFGREPYGNLSTLRHASSILQRKAREGVSGPEADARTEPVPSPSLNTLTSPVSTPGLLADDDAAQLLPGQMRKGDFLSQLRTAVTATAEDSLRGTVWSTLGCPWIDHWFGYYGNRSAMHIEQTIHRYAPGTSGLTSASDYIPVICSRVRQAIATWSSSGESASTAPSGLPEAAPPEGTPPSTPGSISFKAQENGVHEAPDPQAIQAHLTPGTALDPDVRGRMESAFGQDFSDVRVHTDARSGRLSDSLHARAFTIGKDIAFGSGEYLPGTLIGDALIAHELAHVMQQRGATASGPAEKGASRGPLEEEADMSAVGAVLSLWGGIKSGFANIAQNALPRLRSGLKLQRCSKSEPVAARMPEPIPSDPHAVYEEKLREAVRLLNGASFGRAEGSRAGWDLREDYDSDYWYDTGSPEGDDVMLVLRSGKRPSDAIDAMFAHLDEWRIDCAQFIQIAQWYAMRHAFGADEFNKRVGGGLNFRLRPHSSTGIGTREMWFRPRPRFGMKRNSDRQIEPRSVEQLIAAAPTGSRVMWTNLRAPERSAFRNENTIKLGPDTFAAHGFGGDRNTFTRTEIEWNLARAENTSADAAYVAANIFIGEIEYYDTP